MSEQVIYSERVGGDYDPNCDACKRLIAHTRHVLIPASHDSKIASEVSAMNDRHKVRIRRATPEEAAQHPDGNVVIAECSHDSRIANLEWAVVESAVAYELARPDYNDGNTLTRTAAFVAQMQAQRELETATRALITAREEGDTSSEHENARRLGNNSPIS